MALSNGSSIIFLFLIINVIVQSAPVPNNEEFCSKREQFTRTAKDLKNLVLKMMDVSKPILHMYSHVCIAMYIYRLIIYFAGTQCYDTPY